MLLLAATLVGRLGVGWYFLYPLPFHSGGTWPPWATAALFAALAIMGVGWTLWAGDLLWAIARRYRLSDALGWHYLAGRDTPEVPPIVIIATVSFIGVLAGLVAAVVILVLVAFEQLDGRLHQRRAAHQEPDVLLRPHAREHHDVLRRRDGLRDHARLHGPAVEDATRWSRSRGTSCCCW